LTSLQQHLLAGEAADPRGGAANPPPAISLRGVSKRYGREVALDDVELEIAEGEFFCLLGPSGCGKTTTLNLLGGFVTPSAGVIYIRGEQVDRLPPHARDVNTVFQSYALFPHMTVAENVGFGLKMAHVGRRDRAGRVADALAMVGLERLGDRHPRELSGGQQQRVAVARALINRPSVLLLDEPLGALDLKLRKRLQLELAEIHREVGGVFVYVTHDQEEALGLADRIAVMRNGRIEQVGSPREIYLQPRTRFVADFIGESNFIAVGGRVLMVRPEQIRISPHDGVVAGAVIHSSFLGSCTRVAVSCDACSEPVLVELHGQEAAGVADVTPGRRVWLSWDREAAVLINDSEEEDS
jgi:ABC-type Fe3+/spermidine/putrescine transport system ATPase subunit